MDQRLLQFGNVVGQETVPTAQPPWTEDEFLDIVISALRAEIHSGDQILMQRMRELEQQVE